MIILDKELCTGCSGCMMLCPQFAIYQIDEYPMIDKSTCTLCGVCVSGCPVGALKFLGDGMNKE